METTILQDLTRDTLLGQEIERIQSKLAHYQGRVDRGTADDEDRVALALYRRIHAALEGMV